MIAMTLIAAAVIITLVGLIGLLQEDRTVEVQVTATGAIRSQTEEIVSVAADAKSMDSLAAAVIQYYATTFDRDNEKIPLGPDGAVLPRVELVDDNSKLLYRFPIRYPGDATRTSTGEFDVNRNAVGTITFYLDETAVKAPDDAAQVWQDLGDGSGGLASGFDMNQDGEITPQTAAISMALLKNDPMALGILQMPVDIRVMFYNDPRHTLLAYSQARRIVITESRDRSAFLTP
jgi:hypothetical protein